VCVCVCEICNLQIVLIQYKCHFRLLFIIFDKNDISTHTANIL
jgi:hypothetical protein